MRINKFVGKNFRCFSDISLDLNHPLVLIEGMNGSGKTSLLEALYYACYLRSFRTHSPRELVKFGASDFFIKLSLSDTIIGQQEIQIGFSTGKKLVKIGQKVVSSYKELMDLYRIVSLTEDDLALVQESPQIRRSFMDQALILLNPSFASLLRDLRTISENRSALIAGQKVDNSLYVVISNQLWDISQKVQRARIELLADLETEINRLLAEHFDENDRVELVYQKKMMNSYESFEEMASTKSLFQSELRMRRGLFGAHLDDFLITFQKKQSRAYASRGQQKLIVALIKVAYISLLTRLVGQAIFVLDDFITDFDEQRIEKLITILGNLPVQMIFTIPLKGGFLQEILRQRGAAVLSLTS